MNKLKTFLKSAGIATKAVLTAAAIAVIFTLIQVAFMLMNLASTVGNLVGVLILVFTAVFTLSTLFQIAKYYNEKL